MSLIICLFIGDKFFIQNVALKLDMQDLLHMAAVILYIFGCQWNLFWMV